MNPAFSDARPPTVSPDRRSVSQDEATTPTIVGIENSPPEKYSWWSWPHLLSLDAPLVALVWQRWWAHAVGITLPWSREIILGLGVWLIYLADRLADTSGQNHRIDEAARHRFSRDRRTILRALTLLIAITLVIVTPVCLPSAEFHAGLSLLAVTLGYFWLIHCWPARGWAALLPKEAVVGVVFGAGSAFFVFSRSSHLPVSFWMGTILFSAVCFLNGALITRWEGHHRDLYERFSLLRAFPRLSARIGPVCIVVAATALAASSVTSTSCATPVAISALLLAGLNLCEDRMSLNALRVLADVVLLTPLLGMF